MELRRVGGGVAAMVEENRRRSTKFRGGQRRDGAKDDSRAAVEVLEAGSGAGFADDLGKDRQTS